MKKKSSPQGKYSSVSGIDIEDIKMSDHRSFQLHKKPFKEFKNMS